MSTKKPTPVLPQRGRKVCPICGNSSYSSEGIHPQCAVRQADAPREQQLKKQKEQDAKRKTKTKKPVTANWSTWSKKTCPECGAETHVRKKACECGHDFGS
jgi:predicted RNA-binding Zn-ribbon protein involved in translation (DUF1610 family)